jgi:hypothetical protein
MVSGLERFHCSYMPSSPLVVYKPWVLSIFNWLPWDKHFLHHVCCFTFQMVMAACVCVCVGVCVCVCVCACECVCVHWYYYQSCIRFFFLLFFRCCRLRRVMRSWEHDQGRWLHLRRVWEPHSRRSKVKVRWLVGPYHTLPCIFQVWLLMYTLGAPPPHPFFDFCFEKSIYTKWAIPQLWSSWHALSYYHEYQSLFQDFAQEGANTYICSSKLQGGVANANPRGGGAIPY